MDLNEAIQTVMETAVAAAGAEKKVVVIPLPKEPDYVYGVIKADGTFSKEYAEPHPRMHVLFSVDQIGEFVEGIQSVLDCAPTVWLSPEGVTVRIDDSAHLNRHGKAVVGLPTTPQFQRLRDLEKGVKLSQKAFVRMLRTDLAECMTDLLGGLLRSVRTLSFSSGATGHGVVEHGRESFGREIEASVKSTMGAIPEEITLLVRIYTDRALRVKRPVKCLVEVDPSDNTLSLQPLPGQLDEVVQAEMEHLESMLEANVKVPIYFGKP